MRRRSILRLYPAAQTYAARYARRRRAVCSWGIGPPICDTSLRAPRTASCDCSFPTDTTSIHAPNCRALPFVARCSDSRFFLRKEASAVIETTTHWYIRVPAARCTPPLSWICLNSRRRGLTQYVSAEPYTSAHPSNFIAKSRGDWAVRRIWDVRRGWNVHHGR